MSCLLIDICLQSHSSASLDRAALGEDSGKVDVIGVDFEWFFTLTVVDAVHRHGDEAVAGHLKTRVSFSVELFEEWCAADEDLVLSVIVTGHFS